VPPSDGNGKVPRATKRPLPTEAASKLSGVMDTAILLSEPPTAWQVDNTGGWCHMTFPQFAHHL